MMTGHMVRRNIQPIVNTNNEVKKATIIDERKVARMVARFAFHEIKVIKNMQIKISKSKTSISTNQRKECMITIVQSLRRF